MVNATTPSSELWSGSPDDECRACNGTLSAGGEFGCAGPCTVCGGKSKRTRSAVTGKPLEPSGERRFSCQLCDNPEPHAHTVDELPASESSGEAGPVSFVRRNTEFGIPEYVPSPDPGLSGMVEKLSHAITSVEFPDIPRADLSAEDRRVADNYAAKLATALGSATPLPVARIEEVDMAAVQRGINRLRAIRYRSPADEIEKLLSLTTPVAVEGGERLRAFKELVAAVELDFCDETTDAEAPDEDSVQGLDGKLSALTFGIIRRARAALRPPVEEGGKTR